MSEKSRTPSPNRQRNFERGVFSSLSAVSFLKSNGETKKSAGAVSPRPIPKSRSPLRSHAFSKAKSPDHSLRQASPMNRSDLYSKEELNIINPSTPQPRQRDEISKLQEQVRVLTAQLQRERKSSQKAELDLKDLERRYKAEVVQIQADAELVKSSLQKAKLANKALLIDKDKATQDLKAKSSALEELKTQVKSLVTVFIEALEITVRQDEAGLGRVQKIVGYKLNTIRTYINSDFDQEVKRLNSLSYRSMVKPPSVQSIYTAEPDSFYSTEKQAITYEVEFFTEDSQTEDEQGSKLPDHGKISFQEPPEEPYTLHKSKSLEGYAIADYDFGAEQDGDLNIRKGELIQVLSKDESGWWFGRIGGRSGNFPSNFVHLVC